MSRDSTTSTQKVTELSFDTILEAVKTITPEKRMWIEVNRKGYRWLSSKFLEHKTNDNFIGSLYGIEIRIRPYLKRMRIYTEK